MEEDGSDVVLKLPREIVENVEKTTLIYRMLVRCSGKIKVVEKGKVEEYLYLA